jgi:hypothetical protein
MGEETASDIVLDKGWSGGILVRQGDGVMYGDPHFKDPEPVEWITPMTAYNRQESAFASHRNKCIRKTGDRLAYPTVAQVIRAYNRRRYWTEGSLAR